MEFEDILKKIGGYGKYQRNMVWFFLTPVTMIIPWFIMTNVFLVSVPDHWCYVPEIATSGLNNLDKKKLIAPFTESSCLMYNISYSDFRAVKSLQRSSQLIPCANGWEYDKSNYDFTAATQWNLVCDKSQYTNLILTLQNLGGIIGTPIFSFLSDKWGRKMVYFMVVSVTVICYLICPLAENFSTFAIIRAVTGSIYPTILILPYILVMELISPEKRTRISYMWNFSWVVGLCILPLIVYLSRNWHILCWINSAAALLIIVYWKFIPESPRWLISQKQYKEAQKIMMEIAKINGHSPNAKTLLTDIQVLGDKMDLEEKENKGNFYAFIKVPRLRKHFLILTAMSLANLTIYQIIHYNISNLEGNEFVIFFFLALAEAPGCILLWFLMEKIGRRWSATAGFIVGGVACALPLTGLPYSDIASSILGKFIVAGLFMVTDQQICELYPTVARSFGMGASKCISNGCAFALPYVIHLSIYGKSIPFVFISLTCFSAGILASFLPETLNKNLPQTIADAEEFGNDQKYFSFKK